MGGAGSAACGFAGSGGGCCGVGAADGCACSIARMTAVPGAVADDGDDNGGAVAPGVGVASFFAPPPFAFAAGGGGVAAGAGLVEVFPAFAARSSPPRACLPMGGIMPRAGES